MGWTSPALPHIADCEKDCDFHFDDDTGKDAIREHDLKQLELHIKTHVNE